MTEEKRFQYYAFISYNHADAEWAEWLQKRLENYRIPSIIRKELGNRIPPHIRPIFRDKSDMGVGDMEKSLRAELEDSRYLIVICSPNSAKEGKWVDREIAHFKAIGRGNRIIPFIVSGIPHAEDPDQECYAPSLRSVEGNILGASLHQLSKEEAFIKILAALLGVKYDQLWQRHERQRKRVIKIQIVAGLTLLAAVVAGIYSWWDYSRLKVAYYAEYVEKQGVPEGIVPLTRKQLAHRQYSWRIETQKRKVRRLASVNSTGHPRAMLDADDQSKPVDRRYFYRDSGVESVEDYSPEGRFLIRRTFNRGLQYMQFFQRETIAPMSMGAHTAIIKNDLNWQQKSEICGYRFEYDDRGRIFRQMYLNRNASPSADADGMFGKEFLYNQQGEVEHVTYLNNTREPMSVSGVSSTRYSYDGKGNHIKTEWLDLHGKPARNLQQIATRKVDFDGWGNEQQISLYDEDGKPCLHKDGWAKLTMKYDERGNLIEQACFGVDGQPCLHKNGWDKLTNKYDERGNQIEQACFGVDGQPCFHNNGWAKLTMKYDERGNEIEEAFFGVDGQPCLHKNGWAKLTNKYDERGNQIEQAYFGVDGQPCLHNNGWAKLTIKYDERGNQIEEACFGMDGQPCFHNNGWAKFTNKYDERGNRIEEACFGVDGQPCLGKEGWAKSTCKYDELGNQIEEAYFGVDGQPCLGKEGWAKSTYKYDERGNQIEKACFGVDGKAVVIGKGSN